MASPRGDTTPFAPNNTYDQQRRYQFPQPAIPGLYNPVLAAAQPYASSSSQYAPPPAQHPQPQEPSPGGFYVPNMLKPGMRGTPTMSRSGSQDHLFFRSGPPNVPTRPRPRQSETSPPPPLPHKPDFSQPPHPAKHVSSPAGMLPQAYPQPGPSQAPPIPAKIPLDFSSPEPARTDRDEYDELQRVLEVSARELQAKREQSLRQEDEDLARAMAESLQWTPSAPSLSGPSALMPSRISYDVSEAASPVELHRPLPSASPASSDHNGSTPPTSVYSHDIHPVTSSPKNMSRQIAEDEAFARRLLEEEEEEEAEEEEAEPPAQVVTPAPATPEPPRERPGLPLYNEAVSNAASPVYSPTQNSAKSTSNDISPVAFPSASLAPPPFNHSHSTPVGSRSSSPGPTLSRSTSANATLASHALAHQAEPRAVRSQSFGAYDARPREPYPNASPLTSSSSLAVPSPARPMSTATSSLFTVDEMGEAASTSSHSSEPPTSLTANQYVDEELLRGVSLGFGPPTINSSLNPWPGPIPNVIDLPHGRCPPFHIKSPNWRDLLKLMARLSGTRIQASIDTIAVIKDAKLRVVVNFVKVHQASQEWQVILYMTIDQPVPSNHPNAWKYRNGDPGTLPFSYSLSPTPAPLRDGADGLMSKWYNIPLTANTPYPTLPITFPNLATYLMSAVEDSRRAMNDGSSGLRRLAKSIDLIYPSEERGEGAAPERRGLFNRLMGRGNKTSRDRNADAYQLVTPFVPDEWGG